MRYALIAFLTGLVCTIALYGAQAGPDTTQTCALPAPVTRDCTH